VDDACHKLEANLTSWFSNLKSVPASARCRTSGQGTSPRGTNVGSEHGEVAGAGRAEETAVKARLSDAAAKTETRGGCCAAAAANATGGERSIDAAMWWRKTTKAGEGRRRRKVRGGGTSRFMPAVDFRSCGAGAAVGSERGTAGRLLLWLVSVFSISFSSQFLFSSF
jgi:hypothetical protein